MIAADMMELSASGVGTTKIVSKSAVVEGTPLELSRRGGKIPAGAGVEL